MRKILCAIFLLCSAGISFSVEYQLNYTVEIIKYPGSAFAKRQLDLIKEKNPSDVKYIKHLENVIEKGESFSYSFPIKVGFKEGFVNTFVVEDFAPPVSNAIVLCGTDCPNKYTITSDGTNTTTKMSKNGKDQKDTPSVENGIAEPAVSQFMENYNYLKIVKAKWFCFSLKRLFVSCSETNNQLLISVREKIWGNNKIKITFEKDSEGNYILQSRENETATCKDKIKLINKIQI